MGWRKPGPHSCSQKNFQEYNAITKQWWHGKIMMEATTRNPSSLRVQEFRYQETGRSHCDGGFRVRSGCGTEFQVNGLNWQRLGTERWHAALGRGARPSLWRHAKVWAAHSEEGPSPAPHCHWRSFTKFRCWEHLAVGTPSPLHLHSHYCHLERKTFHSYHPT